MMKNRLIVLLALGALSFAPAVEAGRKPHDKKSCEAKPACAAPKCDTQESYETVYEPCEKWVKVRGTCPHKITTKVRTCTEQSKKCDGPCAATCDNEVKDGSEEME